MQIADALFPGVDPLGQTVRIAGRSFRIVGVQAQQGTAGGVTLDRYMWMPLGAFERAFGAPDSVQVFAKAPDGGTFTAAEDRAHATLRARRHLGVAAAATRLCVTGLRGRRGAIAADAAAVRPRLRRVELLCHRF